MQQVVAQASRRDEGESVPARDRVFSIFEPPTELIERGRRNKPIEFGHTVLLCQTPEKFITDYEVYEHRLADCELTETVLDRHEALSPLKCAPAIRDFVPTARPANNWKHAWGRSPFPAGCVLSPTR